MGRAIVRKPQVFCMDEPLSNLDAKMRVQTRTDIAKLQADLGVTTVYVTHDQVEAMTMGDRVAVMKLGDLQQVDTPLNLYDKPVNLFVAGFIGSPADEPARGARPSTARPRSASYLVPVDPTAAQQDAGQHHRRRAPRGLAAGLATSEGGLPVEVTVVEELGADALRLRHQRRRGHARTTSSSGSAARDTVHKGDTIYVTTDPQHVHVFDTDTGERLSD